MPSNQPPSPVRRIIEEAFSRGNLAVVDELLARDHHSNIAIGGVPNGPQGLKLLIALFRTAFPDLVCTVEEEIVDGDKFAVRWAMRGIHRGMFLGNPPTGKQVNAPCVIFGRTENSRIIEDWIMIDQTSILQQMGLIPPVVRL